MELIPIEQAQAEGPLSRRVLEYGRRFGQVIALAGERQVTPQDWELLGEMLDRERFERVGAYQQSMRWDDYLVLLCGFANASTWQGKLRRVTEGKGVVYLEMVESGARRDGSGSFATNTLTVYEFDDAEKLVRLWVYVQGEH